jgi:hypothetical protein
MPVDFFETELTKVRDRFNGTFGSVTVCNIRTRQNVILAIIGMGLSQRKISAAGDKDSVRPDIQRFVKTRNNLNKIFNQFGKENHHVEPTEQRDTVADSKAVRDRTLTA